MEVLVVLFRKYEIIAFVIFSSPLLGYEMMPGWGKIMSMPIYF
jgi:hypothetical protein